MATKEFHHPRVNQAAGMISVQASCSPDDALRILRERALVTGESVDDLAAATVERRIRFGPDA